MRARAALRRPRKLMALLAAAAVVFGLSAIIAPLVSADNEGVCITDADLGLAATASEDEAGAIILTWDPVNCGDEVENIRYEYATGDETPAWDSGDWKPVTGATVSAGRWTLNYVGDEGETYRFWLRVKGMAPVAGDEVCEPILEQVVDEDGEPVFDEEDAPVMQDTGEQACHTPVTDTEFVSDASGPGEATAPKAQDTVPVLEFVERTERGFTFTATNLDDFTNGVERLRVIKSGALGWTKEIQPADLPYTLTDTNSGETVAVEVQVLEAGFVYSEPSEGLEGQALYDAVPPTIKVLDRTDDGFVAAITNLDTYWPKDPPDLPGEPGNWPPTGYTDAFYLDTTELQVTKTTTGGTLYCDGLNSHNGCQYGRIVVTGLTSGQSATVTVSVTDGNHPPAATSVTSQAKFTEGLKVPTLEVVDGSRTATGFTVAITNYTEFAGSGAYGDGGTQHSNSYYTDRVITAQVVGEKGANPKLTCGAGSAATTATCSTDVISVSGLANGGGATITVTVTSKNHPDTSGSITARALYVPEVPTFGNVTRTADGFVVKMDNFAMFGKAPYGSGSTVTATVTGPNGGTEPLADARVRCDGSLDAGSTNSMDCTSGTIVVSGLPAGSKADVLVTVTSDNHPDSGARITGEALGTAVPVTLGEVVSGKGFIRVQIKDMDQAATYTVTTDAGTALITDGWVNVTGLQPGQTANVTVTAKRPTFADGQAKTTGAALRGAPSITVGTIIPRDGGFSVPITDYDATATYEAMVEGGGTATVEGASGRVTGLKTGDAATLTLTVSREGYESATATAAYRMPADAGTDANFTGGAWPPQVEELAAGLGAVTRNGAPVKSTTKVAKKKATVRWNGMTYTAAHVIDGKAQKTRQKELYVPWGGEVKVDVKGFAPDSRVQVWIFSTPILLGTFTTGATSRGQLTVQMPPYLEAGDHTLVVSGVNTAGELVTMATGLTLQAPTVTDGGDDADRSTETIPPASGGSDNAAGSNNSAGSSSGSAGSGGAAGSSDGGRVVGVQKSKDGALANTGTRTFPELRLALILILLGVGLVVATRRRSIDDAPASAPRSVARAVTPPTGAIRLRNPGAERSGRPAQPVKRSRFRRPAAPPRVPVTGLDNLGPGNPLPNVSTAAPTLKGWVDAVSGGRTALTPPRHGAQASVRVQPRAMSPRQTPVPAEVRRIADLLADPER